MRHDEQVRLIKQLCAHLDAGTNVDAGGLRRNPTTTYTDPDQAEREWRECLGLVEQATYRRLLGQDPLPALDRA